MEYLVILGVMFLTFVFSVLTLDWYNRNYPPDSEKE
jgi:hypothetical protein